MAETVDTPMESTSKIQIEEEELLTDEGRYQRLVGKLICLSHTRQDIALQWEWVTRYL